MAGDAGRARPLVASSQLFIRWAELGAWRRLLETAQGARGRARHGVPRRDPHQGAPQGRGRAQKGGTGEQRDRREGWAGRAGASAPRRASSRRAGRAVAFALPRGRRTSCRWRRGCSTGSRGAAVGGGRPRLQLGRLPRARLGRGRAAAIRRATRRVACPDASTTTATGSSGSGLKEWRAVGTLYEKVRQSCHGMSPAVNSTPARCNPGADDDLRARARRFDERGEAAPVRNSPRRARPPKDEGLAGGGATERRHRLPRGAVREWKRRWSSYAVNGEQTDPPMVASWAAAAVELRHATPRRHERPDLDASHSWTRAESELSVTTPMVEPRTCPTGSPPPPPARRRAGRRSGP